MDSLVARVRAQTQSQNGKAHPDAHGFSLLQPLFHIQATAFMLNQVKFNMELADPGVQISKIQCALNLWAKRSTYIVNRAARGSILTGGASLVDSVNLATPSLLRARRSIGGNFCSHS